MSLRHRKLLVVAVIPLLLLTTSCTRFKVSYDIRSKNEINYVMDIGVEKGSEAAERVRKDNPCTEESESASDQRDKLNLPKTAKFEPYEDDQFVGCRVSGTGKVAEPQSGGSQITLNDGFWEFRLIIPAHKNKPEPDGVSDFEVKVKFPGEVVEASGSGKIEGDTVTWNDPVEALSSDGLYAKAKAGRALATLPWALIPIALLLLLLAVAALVAFLLTRNKKPQPFPVGGGYQQQSWNYQQQPGGQPQQPWNYPQEPGGHPQQPGGNYQQQTWNYPQQPSGQNPPQPGNYQQPSGYPQQPGGQNPQQPWSG